MSTQHFSYYVLGSLFLGSLFPVSDQCPRDKFGPNCQYDCHCNHRFFRKYGLGCRGYCSPPWSGPTCQRANIALGMNASQSSTLEDNHESYGAQKAVNWDSTNACARTKRESSPRWSVSLGNVHNMYRFKIYYSETNDCIRFWRDQRRHRFSVYVGNSSTGSYQLCYKYYRPYCDSPFDVVSHSCNTVVYGDTFNITMSRNTVHLCWVKIFVCSAGWYGEMCDKRCSSETRCARCDGTGITCEECVHGSHGEDCELKCGHCWNDVTCSKKSGECPVTANNPRCETGYRGTDCSQGCEDGTWGPDCSQRCGRCRYDRPCNKLTGECILTRSNVRCASGYIGMNCNRPCETGTWGDNCANSCGATCVGARCNIQSGICEEECEDGKWGPDCSQRCGRCRDDSPCNKLTGECILTRSNVRCASGYIGMNCNRSCETGTWGDNCANSCGATCVGARCNIQSGICEEGDDTVLLLKSGISGGGIIITVAFITLVVIIVILVRLYRKVTRRNKDAPEDVSSQTGQRDADHMPLEQPVDGSCAYHAQIYENLPGQRDADHVSLKYQITPQPVDGSCAHHEQIYENLPGQRDGDHVSLEYQIPIQPVDGSSTLEDSTYEDVRGFPA